MKKFIFNIIKFSLLLLTVFFFLLCFVFFIAAPQYQTLYSAAIVDKIERLESIQEPKIILVGNSNLAFGINSKMIEDALGMPVVNLGGHGGLGNQFHYNLAKRNMGEGDIVVVVPTELDDGGINDTELAWVTIENHEGFWEFVPQEDWFEMLKALPQYCVRTIVYYITGMENENAYMWYARSAFNEYGDISYPRETGQMDASRFTGQLPTTTDIGIEQLNSFATYCEEQNAKCLVAWYPIMFSEYTASGTDFERYQQELREKVQCDYISDYKDYLLEPEFFLDTQYHLTDEGTTIRTKQLIKDLQNWMHSFE